MNRIRLLSLAAGLALLGPAGCGGGSPTLVKGKVTQGGAPVEGAQLTFFNPDGRSAQFAATSGSDGAYRLTIPAGNKFEEGDYKVTAVKYVAKGGAKIPTTEDGQPDLEQLKLSGGATNALPRQYERPDATPLRAALKRGGEVAADFELAAK